MHDETLPDDFNYYKEAAFCSMCGPKFLLDELVKQGGPAFNKEVHGLEKEDLTQLVTLQAEDAGEPRN